MLLMITTMNNIDNDIDNAANKNSNIARARELCPSRSLRGLQTRKR